MSEDEAMASDGSPSPPPAKPAKKERPKRVITPEERERLAKARAAAIAARKKNAAAKREERELHEKIKEGERHKLRQAAAEAERLVNGGSTSKPPERAPSPEEPQEPAKRKREVVRDDEDEAPQQRPAPRDDRVDWDEYDARSRARAHYKQALARQRGALITRTLYGF